MMRHHLHMPSYFLGTFTEYPYIKIPDLGRLPNQGFIFHTCSDFIEYHFTIRVPVSDNIAEA